MAEGSEHLKDYLSCNDSSYHKHNLTVSDRSDNVHSGREERNMVISVACARLGCSLSNMNPLIGNFGDSVNDISLDKDYKEVESKMNTTNWCANVARATAGSTVLVNSYCVSWKMPMAMLFVASICMCGCRMKYVYAAKESTCYREISEIDSKLQESSVSP